jgi:beta-1,4-mannosyltransferase
MIAKLYEKLYGKCAAINFCVSEAMKTNLKNEINIDAINLPDRAMKNVFKRLNLKETHELFERYKEFKDKFTEIDDDGLIKYKPGRPILMISSTSWTPDEDFDLLLNSLIETEKIILKNSEISKIKKVLFIITGRGPGRESFMKKVELTDFKIFTIKSIWMESDDYPKLLGTADMGVCLHYSSSGFDLPMKVVDMFSAQLPVATYDYETVHELVKKNLNGFLFKSKEELSLIVEKVIMEYSIKNSNEKIEKFRNNLENFSHYDWISQWKDIAYDVIVEKSKIKLHVE